jgi:hypothetical protein
MVRRPSSTLPPFEPDLPDPADRHSSPGFHHEFLAYDRRSFGEILSDWQQHVAPGNLTGFINDHLHLGGTLTASDVTAIIAGPEAGGAAPNHELACLISALVSPTVATPLVMRRRGDAAHNKARYGSLPIIPVTQEAFQRCRRQVMHALLNAPSAPPGFSADYDAFRAFLLDALQSAAGDVTIQPHQTLLNLANYLQVPANVLLGETRLSQADAL